MIMSFATTTAGRPDLIDCGINSSSFPYSFFKPLQTILPYETNSLAARMLGTRYLRMYCTHFYKHGGLEVVHCH